MNRRSIYAIGALTVLVAAVYFLVVEQPASRSASDSPAAQDALLSTSVGADSVAPSRDASALSASGVQAAVDQLAIPTRIVDFAKHRPDTSTPLRVVYDGLKAAADSGDGNAALDLAGSLIECAEAPANTEGLEKQLLDLYQTRRVTGYAGQVHDLDGEAEKHRDRYEFCQGISREQIKEAYRYLRVSAENGNLEATVRLNSYGPMLYEEVFEALDIAWESRQEMHSVTNRLTFEAAEAGSAAAVLKIGRNMAEGGDLLSADEARAYRIAGLHLAVLHGSNRDSYSRQLREEIASIRPSQRAQIIESVNAILMRENCCFHYR